MDAREPIEVLGTGRTIADDGSVLPTVVLAADERPDVADLARVHAIEGIGDLTTTVAVVGASMIMTVELSSPVVARFAIRFDLAEHLTVLVEAAVAGHLVLATSDPGLAGPDPLWLAIDIDGARLAEVLAAT